MSTDTHPACTCALGECPRRGHIPQPADCGHPGVFAHVGLGPGRGFRSVCHRLACRQVAEHLTRYFPSQEALGRAIGRLTGVAGRAGGWIYDDTGAPLCQGWASYAHLWVGSRSGGVSTITYDKDHGYLASETGLRRVAAHLDRKARKAAEAAAAQTGAIT